MLKGRLKVQMDLGRQDKWANRNLREFNMNKCKVPHLGRTGSCNSTGQALPGAPSSSAYSKIIELTELGCPQQCGATR